jgi:predicted nucleotidyltransferase
MVFSLWSNRLPGTEVDLFVSEPFPFDEMLQRADRVLIGEAEVPVAALQDLIAMKSGTGRSKDRQDVEELKHILRRREAGET